MSGPEQRLLALWRSEVERHIVGDPTPVTELMLTLLAGGHALLESAPGLGKTTLVRTVAISAGLDLGRVQCTPDLMPMDITGGDVVLPEQSNTPGRSFFAPAPSSTNWCWPTSSTAPRRARSRPCLKRCKSARSRRRG